MITNMHQNLDVCDIFGQIPKSIDQVSYFLPNDFLAIFPKLVLI